MKKFEWSLLLGSLWLCISLSLFYLYEKYAPPYEGRVRLSGLAETVEVYRDVWGVPHIRAEQETDAYRAFGFVMASDRLFQMEILRRVSSGTLSEIVGPKALKWDRLVRTLRLKTFAAEQMQSQVNQWNPQTKQMLLAFLEGVNFYLETRPLPPEFFLLGVRPRPFGVEDMLTFSGHMALGFAYGYRADPLLDQLNQKLSAGQLEMLRIAPRKKSEGKRVVQMQEAFWKSYQSAMQAVESYVTQFSGLHGSNAFVLGGDRTLSGFPILANDPHIAFSNPNIWYEAHLKASDWEIYGHYFPLIPFAVLGHNQQLGWGLTMSLVDDMDLYLEKRHPEDPTLVAFKGKWEKLRSDAQVIKVKGQADVHLDVQISRHGPLLDPLLRTSDKESSLALKWGFYHPENNLLDAFYLMGKAQNRQQFAKALPLIGAPGMNVLYADRFGEIAWWMVGKIPLRPQHVQADQVLEGDTGRDEYIGYMPFEEQPKRINPKDQLIVSANTLPWVRGHRIAGYYDPWDRYQRLLNLLSKGGRWTLEGLRSVQTDSYAYASSAVLPRLLLELKKSVYFQKKIYRQVFGILEEWNGKSDPDNVGATLYHVWINRTILDVLSGYLGPEQRESLCGLPHVWHFFKKLVYKPEHEWWDDPRTTGKREKMSDRVTQSFVASIAQLERKWGDRVDSWRWGKLHQLLFKHPLGQFWPLNRLFGQGPYAVSGAQHHVNNMKFKYCQKTFDVIAGPSTRRLIDFGSPRESLGILPLGNSGHRLSRHFADQSPLFLRDEYRLQSMHWPKANAKDVRQLLLIPL